MKCIYCQTTIDFLGYCSSCPINVKYYYGYPNILWWYQMFVDKYILEFHTPTWLSRFDHSATKRPLAFELIYLGWTYNTTILSLDYFPNITPANVHDKLKTLLTFL